MQRPTSAMLRTAGLLPFLYCGFAPRKKPWVGLNEPTGNQRRFPRGGAHAHTHTDILFLQLGRVCPGANVHIPWNHHVPLVRAENGVPELRPTSQTSAVKLDAYVCPGVLFCLVACFGVKQKHILQSASFRIEANKRFPARVLLFRRSQQALQIAKRGRHKGFG